MATRVLSLLLVVLGIAMLVRTAAGGGGAGYLLGAAFVAAGGLRLWLAART